MTDSSLRRLTLWSDPHRYGHNRDSADAGCSPAAMIVGSTYYARQKRPGATKAAT